MADPIVKYIIRLKKKHPKKSYKQIIEMLLQKHPQKGRGLISRIKAALNGPRKDKFPPPVRNWLAKEGSQIITRMQVCRVPIVKAIDRAINFIILGAWDAGKKKLGYDNMFHLYANLWLQDGQVWKVEKITSYRFRKAKPQVVMTEKFK